MTHKKRGYNNTLLYCIKLLPQNYTNEKNFLLEIFYVIVTIFLLSLFGSLCWKDSFC